MIIRIKKLTLSVFIVFLFLQNAGLSRADVPRDVKGLYQTIQGDIFWTGSSLVEKNRDKIADILAGAGKHGLSVRDFEADALEQLLDKKDLSMEDKKQLDQALTYALWRYANELNGGQLSDAKFIELAVSSNMAEQVENLAPKTPLYMRLKTRLSEINKLLAEQVGKDEIPPLRFGGQTLHVGESHPDVPLLRARMIDVDHGDSFGDDPYMYDSVLADAVKSYQAAHGLKADGIVGPSTLAYLNRTLDTERTQIIVNMKRLRDPIWRNRPDLRIDVDIARYWLTAYENGVSAFEMPVVVGSNKRQTVRFSTIMTGVRLNPGWTLPPTIKTEDYIPKLRSNPEWVSEQGVKIYADWSHNSEPIDPTTVDWSLLSDGEIKAMRMYKSAGMENPLGQYRFLMNNKYDIYLHDTNAKELFNRAMRAKSSGCVRVYDPRKIAEFLLKDDPSWTSEKIDDVLASGKTYDVGAKRSIPVYFDYKTVWLDDNDTLVTGVDIYGFDKDVIRDIFKFQRDTKMTLSGIIQSLMVEQASTNESNDTQDGFPISLF